MRPAQRNPTKFHKYRSNRKEYQQVTKTERKHYTETDDIVVPDLPMLRATAKRSVEVSVGFLQSLSPFRRLLSLFTLLLSGCVFAPLFLVPPAGQSDATSSVYGYTDGFGGLECFRMASVCLGGSLLESMSSLLKQAERRL